MQALTIPTSGESCSAAPFALPAAGSSGDAPDGWSPGAPAPATHKRERGPEREEPRKTARALSFAPGEDDGPPLDEEAMKRAVEASLGEFASYMSRTARSIEGERRRILFVLEEFAGADRARHRAAAVPRAHGAPEADPLEGSLVGASVWGRDALFLHDREPGYAAAGPMTETDEPDTLPKAVIHRMVVTTWMIEVAEVNFHFRRTAQLGIALFDAFVLKMRALVHAGAAPRPPPDRAFCGAIALNDAQTVSVACMKIAAKLEEVALREKSFWADLTDGSATIEAIDEMERQVLKVLEWRVNRPTPACFVDLLLSEVAAGLWRASTRRSASALAALLDLRVHGTASLISDLLVCLTGARACILDEKPSRVAEIAVHLALEQLAETEWGADRRDELDRIAEEVERVTSVDREVNRYAAAALGPVVKKFAQRFSVKRLAAAADEASDLKGAPDPSAMHRAIYMKPDTDELALKMREFLEEELSSAKKAKKK
jgi:hypothetical protein